MLGRSYRKKLTKGCVFVTVTARCHKAKKVRRRHFSNAPDGLWLIAHWSETNNHHSKTLWSSTSVALARAGGKILPLPPAAEWMTKVLHGAVTECTGPGKKWFPGCENFVLSVAYHFCLALPEEFSQPGNHSFAGPCSVASNEFSVRPYSWHFQPLLFYSPTQCTSEGQKGDHEIWI